MYYLRAWWGLAFFKVILFLLACSMNSYLEAATEAAHASFVTSASDAQKGLCGAEHDVGRLALRVDNTGSFADGFTDSLIDCMTGLPFRYYPNEYPRGSAISYLYNTGMWIGGVVGIDTLVSVAYDGWHRYHEFFPSDAEAGDIEYRSIAKPEDSIGAISEQDFLVRYTDTFVAPEMGIPPDYFNNRPHKPLHIEVRQASYAWSYDYASDFVLVEAQLENIGKVRLDNVYLGLFFDGDATYAVPPMYDPYDNLAGFLARAPSPQGCGFVDTLNLGWIADNDGDPIDGRFQDVGGLTGKSDPAVAGAMFLSPLSYWEQFSFNWWAGNHIPQLDYGPRRRSNPSTGPFRDFGTGGIGTPEGDANKYYMLRNGELDYDQVRAGQISPVNLTWAYLRPQVALEVSIAADTRFLISRGPYYLNPGASISVAYAILIGDNFHTDPGNLTRLQAGDVDGYYAHLDFSDLAKNAMWAKWIYDNPGVDTDGDGYAGKQRICVFDSQYVDGQWVPVAAETTFYEGDGIPDWRGASPPPAPTYWVYPGYNSIRVRFNGQRSETTKDIFSGIIDFEGYRIYFGRDEREGSLSLIGSFDHENFDKYVYDTHKQPEAGFEIQEIPLTLEQIRCAYGNGAEPCIDSLFDPLAYGDPAHLFSPAGSPDSFFFFTVHDYNASEFGVTTEIRKIFPDEPKPSSFDTLRPEQLTDDGYMKYYEYEFTIRDLLPSVPYYVNVTAFDFGSPKGNLKALETSKTVNIKHCYPAGTPQLADGSDKRVYVYPNPYRIDAHYRDNGYEGRMREDRPNDRVRLVHFANLPAKCTIEIHSLDGDLVRRLEHDMDPSDPNSSHDTWDLITRNTQLTVSGIYYWTVEDERGDVQIGKLVVIM